jgi:predicted adenine nucleotide alpha hydrolase (AANH) superfamily ATPase
MEQINNAIKQLGNNFIDILVKEYSLNKSELETHFQKALGVDVVEPVKVVEQVKVQEVKTENKQRTRGRTPYMCFAMKQRAIEKASGKHEAGQITKVVSDMWKAMSADEKAVYVQESKSDSKDFKKTEKKKGKRPPNAYVLWQTEVRSKYKKDHPTLSFGDLTKVLSGDWKKMTAEDKAPYVERVEKMKAEAASSSDDEVEEKPAEVEEKPVEVEEKPVEVEEKPVEVEEKPVEVEEKPVEVEEKPVEVEEKPAEVEEKPEIVSSTYGTAEDSFLCRLIELRGLTEVDTDDRMAMIKALEEDDANDDSDLSSDEE